MTNTKSNAPRNGSTAHGSINGIKLGLNLPNKDKLKQVEDEEKELQRKLAEIQRKKQQLAGSASSNTQQHQRSGGASSYQNYGAAQRSRPPMPAHLQQRAAMQSNAAANVSSLSNILINYNKVLFRILKCFDLTFVPDPEQVYF